MAYTHTGKGPLTLRKDPIDPITTDWVYFSYANWLRDGESIVSHRADVVGGTIVTDSVYLGTIEDNTGIQYGESYGVQVKPDIETGSLEVSHIVSTSVSVGIDTARLDISHTAVLRITEV